MGSLIICSLHQILRGWSNQEVWGGGLFWGFSWFSSIILGQNCGNWKYEPAACSLLSTEVFLSVLSYYLHVSIQCSWRCSGITVAAYCLQWIIPSIYSYFNHGISKHTWLSNAVMCHINTVVFEAQLKLLGRLVGLCFDNHTFQLNRLFCAWLERKKGGQTPITLTQCGRIQTRWEWGKKEQTISA